MHSSVSIAAVAESSSTCQADARRKRDMPDEKNRSVGRKVDEGKAINQRTWVKVEDGRGNYV
jgi:hypothetical protein